MTKKEITANAEAIARVAKVLLVELSKSVSSDLFGRLDTLEDKLKKIESRLSYIEKDVGKLKASIFITPDFPEYSGSSRSRTVLDNLANSLSSLELWTQQHPRCVCKDLVALQFDDRTGMVRNVTGPTSWHCPVHGQVEVK